jgi:hypothetical protein
MKNLSSNVIRCGANNALTANTSDLVTSIVDLGTVESATAVITYQYSDAGIGNVEFFTSTSDTFIVSGTRQTETTNTKQVAITSDADSLSARLDDGTAASALTVSGNAIALIASDLVVAVELPKVRRYVAMQYTGGAATDRLSVTFIGRDLAEAPWPGARAAY